jgi:hypothetical protein
MPSVRTLFRHKYTISPLQRNTAALVWEKLVHGEQKVPQQETVEIKAIQTEMRELLSQADPNWHKRFSRELNALIFKNRHNKQLKLESRAFPEGLLLEAAKNCKIPLAVFPNHVSMTFTDDNSLCLFTKPKPKKTTPATLSSHSLFYSLTSRFAKTIATRIHASLNTHKIENKSTHVDLIGYTP